MVLCNKELQALDGIESPVRWYRRGRYAALDGAGPSVQDNKGLWKVSGLRVRDKKELWKVLGHRFRTTRGSGRFRAFGFETRRRPGRC
jgi:hypothetical protein